MYELCSIASKYLIRISHIRLYNAEKKNQIQSIWYVKTEGFGDVFIYLKVGNSEFSRMNEYECRVINVRLTAANQSYFVLVGILPEIKVKET